MLDPAQNDTFTDHYLGVPFDLSEVLFIATANFIQNIPGPLLDRMEVVEFAGYTEREKAEIAKKYLIPRQLEEAGLGDKGVTFTDDAVMSIVSASTRARAACASSSAQIGAVARKVARRIAAGEHDGDRRRHDRRRRGARAARPSARCTRSRRPRRTRSASPPACTTRPTGGDIMFVEASIRAARRPAADRTTATAVRGGGHVSLILTGQLGDVMKESARAAFTYATTQRRRSSGSPTIALGVGRGAHPRAAGAIPKDGPSAGVTIATALVSAMSGRPVRKDVAMTGEITLRGRVLPIGGVKEKVLGAHRAGITTIILPEGERGGSRGHPGRVRSQLKFHCPPRSTRCSTSRSCRWPRSRRPRRR